MLRFSLVLAVAVWSGLAAPGAAQAAAPDPADQPLSLREALSLAEVHNRDLQAASQARAGAGAGLDSALATRFPMLSGGAGLGDQVQAPRVSSQLTLDYDLDTHGARSATIRGQEQQRLAAALEWSRVGQAVRRRVSEAYYDLIGADERSRIARLNVTLAETSVGDAQQMLLSGEGTAFDVQRAQVQLGAAQATANDTQAERRVAARSLARVIGLEPGGELKAGREIDRAPAWPHSLPDSLAMGLARRPELRALDAQREGALASVSLARSARQPRTSLFTSTGGSASAPGFAVTPAQGPDLAGGVRLSWLLVDWGMNEAIARQAAQQAAVAETRKGDTALQIRFEVEQAFVLMEAARTNIDIAERTLTIARQGLSSARQRFRGGAGTQTDVLLAQQDLVTAEGNRVQAILAYNKAIAALEQTAAARGLTEEAPATDR